MADTKPSCNLYNVTSVETQEIDKCEIKLNSLRSCTSGLGDQKNLLFKHITGLLSELYWPVKCTGTQEVKKKDPIIKNSSVCRLELNKTVTLHFIRLKVPQHADQALNYTESLLHHIGKSFTYCQGCTAPT